MFKILCVCVRESSKVADIAMLQANNDVIPCAMRCVDVQTCKRERGKKEKKVFNFVEIFFCMQAMSYLVSTEC